ncbi:MAG TPA: hypothetical protein VFW63_05940 [Acidimicrobiales bacterium]|nr:hypothetical protein [Acidimicrobiales bacterium]
MTAPTTDDPRPDLSELRRARAALDAAAEQVSRLSARLEVSDVRVDELETVLDVVLDLVPLQLVVVDRHRRVTALSRAAAEGLGGGVGDPLGALVDAESARRVGRLLDAGVPAEVDLPSLAVGAHARALPQGGAVITSPGT